MKIRDCVDMLGTGGTGTPPPTSGKHTHRLLKGVKLSWLPRSLIVFSPIFKCFASPSVSVCRSVQALFHLSVSLPSNSPVLYRSRCLCSSCLHGIPYNYSHQSFCSVSYVFDPQHRGENLFWCGFFDAESPTT